MSTVIDESLAQVAKTINATHKQAVAAATSAVGHVIAIGRQLSKIKDQGIRLDEWVDANCDFSARRARDYIRAANFYGTRKIPANCDLNLEQLLSLERTKREADMQRIEMMAVEMFKAGRQQKAICEELGIGHKKAKQIYEDCVIPELVEVDWVEKVNVEPVPVLAAADEFYAVIQAHARFSKRTVVAEVIHSIDTTEALWANSVAITKFGCEELIRHAKEGHISISTAAALAKTPRGEQLKSIALDHNIKLEPIDALRMLASEYGNMRREFYRQYGDTVLSDIRNAAMPDDVSNICGLLRSNKEFLLAALDVLEK